MEVICERCNTEYDFDDALVSDRGTTVKCTSCGYQFKITRPQTLAGLSDRWPVCSVDGRTFSFDSLRDLQRAIRAGEVRRDDTLARDGVAPRLLSSIAELEPFFPPTTQRPGPMLSVPPPGSDDSSFPPFSSGRMANMPSSGLPIGLGNVRHHPITVPPPGPSYAGSRGVSPSAGALPQGHERRSPQPGPARSDGRSESDSAPARLSETDFSEPDAHYSHTPSRSSDLSYTPLPAENRPGYSMHDDSDPDAQYRIPVRRPSRAIRTVFALVVLGALLVAAYGVGRKVIPGLNPTPAPSATANAQAREQVSVGLRALGDGDLDGAQEAFDKASALSDHDPTVAVELARMANIRADISWLRTQLLAQSSTDVLELAKRELGERTTRSARLSARAVELGQSDWAAVLEQIDSFRISADLQSARKLVGKLGPHAQQPECAYVIAMLEWAEGAPMGVAAITERLRSAVAEEQSLGRARAALAFVQASGGDRELAASNVETLAKAAHPFPVLVDLKAFLARTPLAAKDAGAGMGADARVALSDAAAGLPGAGQGEGAPEQGSYQQLLRRAHDAKQAGDLNKAEKLYRAVLEQSPGDTEATAGLGDIAKARGDQASSVKYYEQVAHDNPSYLPAIMGVADSKWESGDRAGAIVLYRQVLDRAGSSDCSMCGRARQRIAEGQSPSQGSQPTDEPTAKPPASSKPTPKQPPSKSTPSSADTADLPGWKP